MNNLMLLFGDWKEQMGHLTIDYKMYTEISCVKSTFLFKGKG